MTRASAGALLMGLAQLWVPGPVDAQSLGDVFRKVNPSVVVIRAKGRDVELKGRHS